MFRPALIFKSVVYSFLLMAVLAGCKKAHDHDHLDIGGFQIVSNNEILVQQAGTVVTGSLTIEVGQTSDAMELRFLDPEGNVLVITGNDFRGDVSSSNTSILTATRTGTWTFTLTGVSSGTANLTVGVAHGNHLDYESRPVTVNVVTASGS